MRIIRGVATAVVVAGAAACGGGDEVAAQKAPVKIAVERTAEAATNHAPVIRSVRLDPPAPIDGDRVDAIVSVSDQDGDPVQLGFEWTVAGRPIASGEAFIELKGVRKRDLVEVAVKASDGKRHSETARAEARVRNRRPIVVGIAVSPQPEVLPGEPVVATAQARDPDGDLLSYSYRWRLNGELQTESGDTFETASLTRGDEIQAIVVVSDGSADSDELSSVIVRVGNSHPEIVSTPEGKWTNEGFSYAVEARDPDNDVPLRYSLKAGPRGMRVDSVLGKVVWSPTSDQTGVHPIEIAVSDASGATTVQKFELTVTSESDESAAPPASARR